jgi:hypothetical protein
MITNDFINECKNPANCNRYGKLEIIENNIELNQSNMIQSFTIDSSCYDDGNIIGTVYCKKLTANLIDAIDTSLLDKDEKKWINDYHQMVYEKLSPYMTDSELEFLKNYTREI